MNCSSQRTFRSSVSVVVRVAMPIHLRRADVVLTWITVTWFMGWCFSISGAFVSQEL